MLGSHNSLSYLPIRHWWQKITAPWARCQSLSLQEQYDMGVRLFDIRVRFDKEGRLIFCHNKIIFKYTLTDFLKDTKKFGDRTYYRVILDIRETPKDAEHIKNQFFGFLKEQFRNYDEKVLYEAIVFWEWKDYTDELGFYTKIYPTQEIYGSVSNTIYKYLPPKWYAKIVNPQIRKFYDNSYICLVDYVQMFK